MYKFCDGDLEKMFLLLGKGVYPQEYMNSWEKFDEISIPPEEAFHSKLNLENITDGDYARVQKLWEVFKIENLGKFHDLYNQCDTILHADVFENFGNMCNKMYGLDPANFLTAPALAW